MIVHEKDGNFEHNFMVEIRKKDDERRKIIIKLVSMTLRTTTLNRTSCIVCWIEHQASVNPIDFRLHPYLVAVLWEAITSLIINSSLVCWIIFFHRIEINLMKNSITFRYWRLISEFIPPFFFFIHDSWLSIACHILCIRSYRHQRQATWRIDNECDF